MTMKKERRIDMKRIGTLLLACILSLSLVGCGTNTSDKTNTMNNHSTSGNVRLDGSTSMEPLMTALSEAIKEDYPNLQLEAQFTGSGTGIKSVIAGTVEIGNSSRSLTDEEKSQGLIENIVAIDGIAIITDKNNTITNLTKEQLISIYTGEITNWKDVGGKDQRIVVVGREASSGTRGAFEEILEIKDKCKYANELNEAGAVVAKVQQTPGAIGYISLDNITDTVKAIQLDGIVVSEETVKNGLYKLQRPFVMATKGEVSKQSEQVQAVFQFINSDKGQKVLEKVGLVSPNK